MSKPKEEAAPVPIEDGAPTSETIKAASNPKRRHREQKFLAVPLQPHEKIELGEAMANLMAKRDDVENELAAAKTKAKDAGGILEIQIADNASMLRRGSVDRQIEVEIELDFDKGRVSYTRLDTGEVYEDRPMTYMEKQTELKLA